MLSMLSDWEMAVEYFQEQKPDRLELRVVLNEKVPPAAKVEAPTSFPIKSATPGDVLEPPAKRQVPNKNKKNFLPTSI